MVGRLCFELKCALTGLLSACNPLVTSLQAVFSAGCCCYFADCLFCWVGFGFSVGGKQFLAGLFCITCTVFFLVFFLYCMELLNVFSSSLTMFLSFQLLSLLFLRHFFTYLKFSILQSGSLLVVGKVFCRSVFCSVVFCRIHSSKHTWKSFSP
jgi:hypothetical protein